MEINVYSDNGGSELGALVYAIAMEKSVEVA